MSDNEALALAARIERRREREHGTKKAAYVNAKLNSATWDKAEDPERIRSVRPDLLRIVIASLWPGSSGDWEAVLETDDDAAVGGALHDADVPTTRAKGYVTGLGAQVADGKADGEVLRSIAGVQAAVDQMLARQSESDSRSDRRFATLEDGQRELSERVAKLEESRP